MKDGTDDSQGRNQIISNVNACVAIQEVLKTTLGPRGMDKMIETNKDHTVTNDGATIVDLLDVIHPAARIMAEIAKAQDDEVGDGTTSVVVICAEILKAAKSFIEEGMSPQIIIKAYKKAQAFILERLEEIAVKIDSTPEARRNTLIKCAETSLNSKLLAHYRTFFAEIVVNAVTRLETNILDKKLIGIKHVTGGSVRESMLVDGVAFKKTFSYAGFEQQPKKFTNPKILLLNIELELKAEKETAEIRIEKPADYQALIDAEWTLIYQKLDAIVKSGANIVLSRLPIGDLATQYFADRNVFCAGRVAEEDIDRVSRTTGSKVQTTLNGLTPNVLGHCGKFEEVQLGSERFNFFTECPETKTATIILRGGADQFIQEAERSLNDAIMIVRRAMKAEYIVPGGGAIELEISKLLKDWASKIEGKELAVITRYAKALEVIPKTLAENAGLDPNDIINKLRRIHAVEKDGRFFGVDVNSSKGIQNAYENFVWEPLQVKKNIFISATEAACIILSVDETVKNPQSEEEKKMKGYNAGPMPGVRPTFK